VYWRVSVFFVRQRRRRPVGVCLTNPAGSLSRPYENGRMEEVMQRCFSAPRRVQQHTAVLVYVNVFENFRVSQKNFCPSSIVSDSLSDAVRPTLGCRQTFLIRFRTSDKVIGCVLRNFRVSTKNFFEFQSRSSGWVIGRRPANFRVPCKKIRKSFDGTNSMQK